MAKKPLFAETPMASFHPLAGIFPLLEGDDFTALVADVKANGLHEPIVECENAILDGRNRYRACIEGGVEPRFVTVHTSDPLGYVISANLHRRHLNESARAMIAASLANMQFGDNQHTRGSANLPTLPVSQPKAAKLLHVSPRSVTDAKKVQSVGTTDLIARTARGEIKVSLAAKIAELPLPEQTALLNGDADKLVTAVKAAKREVRERDLAVATRMAAARIGTQLYGVIYADPPWRFEPYSRATGLDRAADNHYSTMTTDEIAALKVPAADDAVLFLWATPAMMLHAVDVMEAWGFAYKSQFAWVKTVPGTGYWVRARHEILLIGTRGDVPAPAPGQQFDSVLVAEAGAHSAKPAMFAVMIEDMYPHAARLEMFARGPGRTGWTGWGNEAGAPDAVAAA